MATTHITVNKACVHNLKSVSVEIPKNSLTVITGPSGSGKSSLAFDTIYVEGQRRYIESLSSYARQFLDQYQAPDVESIEGLSPALAVDQKTRSRNPRSTVGTITEIYDYLRVLYARAGILYCPDSNEIIKTYTPGQISTSLLDYPDKTKIHLLSPVDLEKIKNLKAELSKFAAMGFPRIRVNSNIVPLDDSLQLDPSKVESIDLIIDRIIIKQGIAARLTDSIEHAMKIGDGIINILIDTPDGKTHFFTRSEKNMSLATKKIYPDLEPRLFSFNSPLGACSGCNGLGESKVFSKDMMIIDSSLSILDGAITPLTNKKGFFYKMLLNVAVAENIDLSVPLKKLPKRSVNLLFDGSSKIYKYSFTSKSSRFEFEKPFSGIVEWLEKKYLETGSLVVRAELERYMQIQTCASCSGFRLNKIALLTKIGNKHIMELGSMPISKLFDFFQNITLTAQQEIIGKKLIKEILARLKFLINVGLPYLTLNRSAATLSGGESQRIRLATQIGSALSGVLYVLDEPSIGLHQKDNLKLLEALKNLREIGNTVLVIEHDESTIRQADYIIDIGPGAGAHGGEIVAAGTIDQIISEKNSLTANYLSGIRKIEVPASPRQLKNFIKLKGAKENNLVDLNVDIPLEGLVCITGVSGSGKSSLVHSVLVPAIRNYLSKSKNMLFQKHNYRSISGVSVLKSVIELDQSPIGRTPNSNPATYTGAFDNIRTLFSNTPEAKTRGYKAGRFSFNVKGGRCQECEGNGVKKIEMHFLPDVYITCSECKGKRYNHETLTVLYKGKNIADILDMSIEDALSFFKNHPRLNRVLTVLDDIGLGYIKLGQPATTLSGGEAQRLKLGKELSKTTKGHCLYLLDEPTSGLHFHDIKILLTTINQLIEKGNSVIVIEHNMDVIKTADYIIDLGPEGGDQGGSIVAQGTPHEISLSNSSHTAKYLRMLL